MRTVVYKPHRRRQLGPREEVRHRGTGMVDEAVVESMRMATEGEEDLKALEGVGAEVGAALMTEGTLGVFRLASGDAERPHRRGNLATGGEEDGKADVDAAEGDGRVNFRFP